MGDDTTIYNWTRKDWNVYALSLIPFTVAFMGTAYLLTRVSLYLVVIFLLLYLAINFFQAGACIGCPYRGKSCPAFCGIYLSNIISFRLYKGREFKRSFFNTNANLAQITALIMFLFPIYWLVLIGWYYAVAYVALLAVHIVPFVLYFCPKCSYRHVCPAGRLAQSVGGK